ncbi:prolactin-5A1-like [Psammomys obesus]|uniref:prolactin-5A1-like n=1 Tax=Psammomys obesus TaxID=48139 RepID=UPI00245334D3|nr:prolactin-5A1-like [Psammomys obesus]
MQLSLTQPHYWTLLLVLLSNLLLWENVAPVPMCEAVNGQCQLTLEYLFDQAHDLSKNTKRLISGTFNEFKKLCGLRMNYKEKILQLCYKYSYPVPDKTTQDQKIQPEVLLKVTISMLIGWNSTLRDVVADITDVESIPGVGAFVSKVREITEKFTGLTALLKDVKSLLSLVRLESEENKDYPDSSRLPSLLLLNKPSRLYFYHTLLACLKCDAQKVANHVKILRCKLVPRKC